MRLAVVLAQAGWPRGERPTLITSGAVRVNGATIDTLGANVEPSRDRVE